ncbi:hypothetical protein GGR53DRAFT_204116 [Hypoxylon sp. FL1150]|nr:hypothetical protein GGR53DRAFT_204116 [Hypoxylon sp. FL1150]
MARLNEPMVSTDSVETLRRKFLRQNRDIARVNSTQSLKIRSLENECVRLLSENLDLRGQVLSLRTELEDSKAQRIAIHALEIKEKMEAQLAEWGTMLAGLGHEPVPRVRSPRSPKRAKKSSIGRVSMTEWKRRDTMSSMRDLEAAAAQDGRLPPIWENKACPRETLSREEILALRSIVDENTESPDLGPPPVSRFVDEDPVKIDLPTRPASDKSEPDCSSLQKKLSSLDNKPEQAPAPRAEEKKESASDGVPVNPEPQQTKEVAPIKSQSVDQAAKAHLKRKLREEDEKENAVVSKPPVLVTATANDQPQKMAAVKARPIKLPSNRKDARDKSTGPTTQRKPLSAKSSNENMKSPKKATSKPPVDEMVKETKPKKDPPPVEIPIPQSPPPVAIADVEVETEPEAETLSAEPNLAVPDTPEPTPREDVRDTPPPADISARGEASRGRRTRAAVSYAEPNLRDKMRRPTKQLLDAVAGEGKHIRRTSHSKKDELPSGPSSAVKSEEKPESWKDLPAHGASKHDSDVMASPLARKGSRASPSDDLPTSVVMDRRKRNSNMAITQGATAGDSESSLSSSSTKSHSRSANRRLEEIAAREVEVAKIFDDKSDVYEFPESSPKNCAKQSAPEGAAKKSSGNGSKGVRRSRSRRQSSMVQEDWDLDADTEKAPRHTGSTRRATMMTSKESRAESEYAGPDSFLEGSSFSSAEAEGSAQEQASLRRRSMML